MKNIHKAFFSLTLLLGACDKEETAEPTEQELVAADGEHKGGFMARFDLDQDGAISREEAKGHRLEHKFAELDGDGDGKLTAEELKAMKGRHGRGPGEWRGKSPEERAAKMLARFDANADGAIGRDELADHPLAGRFAEADGDGDGKLSREELVALKGHGGKHGGEHGGGHGGGHGKDPAEHAAKMLARLDADSDGSLSSAEVAEHGHLAEKFAEADTNSDGKLSREELVAFKTAHHGDKHHGDKHHGDRHHGE